MCAQFLMSSPHKVAGPNCPTAMDLDPMGIHRPINLSLDYGPDFAFPCKSKSRLFMTDHEATALRTLLAESLPNLRQFKIGFVMTPRWLALVRQILLENLLPLLNEFYVDAECFDAAVYDEDMNEEVRVVMNRLRVLRFHMRDLDQAFVGLFYMHPDRRLVVNHGPN